MFTPKNIQVALEELYDLCDPDYMMDMLENYGEEFDDISPTLLAQAFQKRAEMVSEYRMLSTIGEGFSYQGTALLQNRAVRLLSFSEVSCITTFVIENEEAICMTEYRSLVTAVECERDISFDMGSLICELDDICMFEHLLNDDATVCEL